MTIRKRLLQLLFLGIAGAAAFFAWHILKSDTHFEEPKKALYIRTGSDFARVQSQLQKGGFIQHTGIFKKLASIKGYNDAAIKPGKYVIEKGSSIYNIISLLKSGEQTPVTLVISKIRTREGLVKKIAENFECESAIISNFLNSNDSLRRYEVDTNTLMSLVMPGTYNILWNAPFQTIFNTLHAEHQKFWNAERLKSAAALGFTPQQVYSIASIVEEETNKEEDKGKIASVYINRLNQGMALGADPTIKFALKDFSLRRIYEKHLFVKSPYNTYQNKGLPPGPICTATEKTIDAVLNAPATNYLFFVAKPEFDGYSNFAATYPEHLRYAKAYQQALDTLMKKKAEGRQ
jgi:UPF0755 protein